MSAPAAIVNEPWDDPLRQREAMRFGMWTFLASEILFFGGLFLVYAVARVVDADGFAAGARETSFGFGFANTVLLLVSSAAMTVSERAAQAGLGRLARNAAIAALVLGAAFLAVKGFEYREDLAKHLFPGEGFPLKEVGAARFWAFYWVATLVHLAHLAVGLGLIARLILVARRDGMAPRWMAVEVTTLYWHFVDAVWIVLFPLVYLVGRG